MYHRIRFEPVVIPTWLFLSYNR